MSDAANPKRISADAEHLIQIAACCNVKSLIGVLENAKLKTTGGFIVDLTDVTAKRHANDRFQTFKLSARRGNLQVDFPPRLYKKLENNTVIDKLYTMMNDNESVDFSINAGDGLQERNTNTPGRGQVVLKKVRSNANVGYVKLKTGVCSPDGNFTSVSLNAAGRTSDDGTKMLNSLLLTKHILDPHRFKEVRLICLVLHVKIAS